MKGPPCGGGWGAGGGGGGGAPGGGGGGGSSFAAATGTNLSSMLSSGFNGQVTITYDPSTDTCPPAATPAAATVVAPRFTG